MAISTNMTPPPIIPVQIRRIQQSMVTLASAAELVSYVVREVAGNEVASSLNGSRITNDTIQTLVLARFRQAMDARQNTSTNPIPSK
ncbi:MAG: hypothetical protein ACR2HF_08240 [Methylococcaceae bacterium]